MVKSSEVFIFYFRDELGVVIGRVEVLAFVCCVSKVGV